MNKWAFKVLAAVLIVAAAGCGNTSEVAMEPVDPASLTPEQQEQMRKVDEAMQKALGPGGMGGVSLPVPPGQPGAPPPAQPQ